MPFKIETRHYNPITNIILSFYKYLKNRNKILWALDLITVDISSYNEYHTIKIIWYTENNIEKGTSANNRSTDLVW